MIISDLCHARSFATTAALRVWKEWWADTDVTGLKIQSGIDQMAADSGIPLALVAHRGEQCFGSILLIEYDLEARPQYSPWIAALRVDPDFRRRGIAWELI